MYDFCNLTKEELNKLEDDREKTIPKMFIETKSDNEIINELRFNYGFINLGYLLINGEDGSKLELHVTNISGKYEQKNIHISFIGVIENNLKKGIGHKYMTILTKLADKYGYSMDLEVDTKFGMNKNVLKSFYKKHGFIEEDDIEDGMFRTVKGVL